MLLPAQPRPQAALRGNNGSAFFFRLHSRAKSAMAEILVSDLCDCRPPLLVGGLFHCHPGIIRMPNRRIPLGGASRAPPSPCLPASDRTSALARISRLFRLLCALFFSLFAIVLAPTGFLKPAQSLAL
jgi:hypothetical protein